MESKTWIVTPDKYETVTHTPEGVEPEMGHWMSPNDFGKELDDRFPGCMAGTAPCPRLIYSTAMISMCRPHDVRDSVLDGSHWIAAEQDRR